MTRSVSEPNSRTRFKAQPRAWTPDLIQQVRQARDNGETYKTIAERLQVGAGALRSMATYRGLTTPVPRKDPEAIGQIKNVTEIPCMRCKKSFKSWNTKSNRHCYECKARWS